MACGLPGARGASQALQAGRKGSAAGRSQIQTHEPGIEALSHPEGAVPVAHTLLGQQGAC